MQTKNKLLLFFLLKEKISRRWNELELGFKSPGQKWDSNWLRLLQAHGPNFDKIEPGIRQNHWTVFQSNALKYMLSYINSLIGSIGPEITDHLVQIGSMSNFLGPGSKLWARSNSKPELRRLFSRSRGRNVWKEIFCSCCCIAMNNFYTVMQRLALRTRCWISAANIWG